MIAPPLIIKRAANRDALKSDTITGRISSLRVTGQGQPTDSGVSPRQQNLGEFRWGVSGLSWGCDK